MYEALTGAGKATVSKSVISLRVAAAQKCVDLGAFASLHPVYGRRVANLVLELARLHRGGASVWVDPDVIAARLGVSRATFYRVVDVAIAAGIISKRLRSRVGTRLWVDWTALGPFFNATLRVADAVRMKAGRYRNRMAAGIAALRSMAKAGFSADLAGSSQAEVTIRQEKRISEEKAQVRAGSSFLSVDDYLQRVSMRVKSGDFRQ